MKFSGKLAVVLTALIVSSFAMTGCNEEKSDNSVIDHTTKELSLGENNDNEPKADKKENVTASAEIVECKKGEVAEQQGFQVKLEKIEQMVAANKERIYIYAIFDIKNTSDNDIVVNRLEHFHIKPDGEEHKQEYVNSLTATVEASKIIKDVKEFDGQTIASGNSAKGYIVFEVPDSTDSFDLTYYPFIYSETNENSIGFNYKLDISDVFVHEE